MNKAILILSFCFFGSYAFAQQAGKCPFPEPAGKVRHDQYSQSSKECIDKSKKEMAEQEDEFDKKKYQSTVRKSIPKKQKQALRYY